MLTANANVSPAIVGHCRGPSTQSAVSCRIWGWLGLILYILASSSAHAWTLPFSRPVPEQNKPAPVQPGLQNPKQVVKSADRTGVEGKAEPKQVCAARQNLIADSTVKVVDFAYMPYCWNGCAVRFQANEVTAKWTSGKLYYTGATCR